MKAQVNRLLASMLIGLVTQTVYAQTEAVRLCPEPWKSHSENPSDCSLKETRVMTWSGVTGARWEVKANIRSGYLAENPEVPFRGNIIYYQGLGDSMLNHMPLFSMLTMAGFRVIAFDYMGQGGSSGSMNDTRILQIGTLGDQIWSLHARDLESYPKKNIIGWSTGGLAAFIQARLSVDVNNIVLIAPGIVPNLIVGEFNYITLPTLTSQTYGQGVSNPHLDPIKPTSPLQVMGFSWNLLVTARAHRGFPVKSAINGFVLLSGNNDTYVNAARTNSILQRLAPHFLIHQYPNALHEIDNEIEPIGSTARRDILDFLIEAN